MARFVANTLTVD